MNTTISVDEITYRSAEETAAEMGLTCSRLYALAIEEYINNHRVDAVTGRLNAYYNTHKAVIGEDIQQSQYNLISREDW
jgi:hypothetical protein